MSKRRIPTRDEHERVLTCNERLTRYGFKALFFSKEGIKDAERPFRLIRNGMRDTIRYFADIESMERYTNRLIHEKDEVDKLNVLLKLYDVDGQKCEVRWDGNKSIFVIHSSGYSSSGYHARFTSVRELSGCVHALVSEAQQGYDD